MKKMTTLLAAAGNVSSKFIVEMKLIGPFTEPLRLEIQQLDAVELESN